MPEPQYLSGSNYGAISNFNAIENCLAIWCYIETILKPGTNIPDSGIRDGETF